MAAPNPYVGLRPFRTDEAVLFFGRRQRTMELLQRLHENRFVAVVGSSAAGKSSLVLAGVLPQLQAGFLVHERDKWLIVMLKPGDAPLSRLAEAFCITEQQARETGAQAIIEAIQKKEDSAQTNCLVVVDQFEELFRFAIAAGKRDDAAEFVETLLAVVEQTAFPVFVIITMRSDFLGDCDIFPGLPEALNRGQYLVPRLTRQQLRESIEGPARLFGARVTARLLDRISNEVTDEPDQLPVLQLALMRTWELWTKNGTADPIDVPDYLRVGGVNDALSRDAESALAGMTEAQLVLAKKIFQALTDTDNNNRRVRRPIRLSQLERITGAGKEDALRILRLFQDGGRCFVLTQKVPGSEDLLIDISHEALIRRWPRLAGWVDEEASSKRVYLDLVDAVNRKKALLHDSDLQVAVQWRNRVQPSIAWAERYAPGFDAAMQYLEQSEKDENRRQLEEVNRRKESERSRRLRWYLAASIAIVLVMGAIAWTAKRAGDEAVRQEKIASAEREEAKKQREIASRALNMLRKSMLIRDAALNNDQDALTALTSGMQPSLIRFQARFTDLNYKNPSGQEVYKFELGPDPASLPRGANSVAFITYLADHPTFQNTLMTSGPSRKFMVSYVGWGCLNRIIALVEYKDLNRAAEASEFDMCKMLGW